jgi:hypothetical protein
MSLKRLDVMRYGDENLDIAPTATNTPGGPALD